MVVVVELEYLLLQQTMLIDRFREQLVQVVEPQLEEEVVEPLGLQMV